MKTIALYIHIPYCLEKCPYCDFHSIPIVKGEIPQEVYANALLAELKMGVERFSLRERKLLSIFFGGGTPSLMSPDFFQKVLDGISQYWALHPDIEVTVETNPATADLKAMQDWQRLGINRVSIGVQSFEAPLLKRLGRNHSAKEAKAAIRMAQEAGFENISADLIFGIEGETQQHLENDLETALSFSLPHLSCYQLTVEPATPLAHWVQTGKFQIPEEEVLEKMHRQVVATLEKKGLQRYEISNYARPGFESRHNLQYWRYGDYLGIGSGAVSFIDGERWRTTRKLKEYCSVDGAFEDQEKIDAKTAWKEKWMMGLRLREGLPLLPDNPIWEGFWNKWSHQKVVSREGGRIRLTEEGSLWYNQIVRDLFDVIDKIQ